MSAPTSSFFVTGGTLRHDAPSYVERQADCDLLEGLLKGEFCYVLTSRQMGKSSLMVRTARKLRDRNIHVVVLDLTAVGQNVTPEQWYDGLITLMARQLNLEDEMERFWMENVRLGPVQRFFSAIRDVAMVRCPGPLVIFVDEIDTVRSLPFSTDEFFAGIRECYNRRSEDAEFNRLTFGLLGVATPSDLIRDTRLTPFNIGERIELNDFAMGDMVPLAKGLARPEQIARRLLERVLYWTGGHPYLTQRLCHALAEHAEATSPRDVDQLCTGLFLSARARERDDNLIFVRERVLNKESERAAVLDLYWNIRRGKRVESDETNPLVSLLLLSGIVGSDGAYLRARNRVYWTVFDHDWVAFSMPQGELRRQRTAFKRGAVGTTAAVAVLVLLLSLPLFKPAADQTSILAAGRGVEIVSAPSFVPAVAVGLGPPAAPAPQPVPTPPTPQTAATNSVQTLAVSGGVIVGLQGTAEVALAGSTKWVSCPTNTQLYPGDHVRTGKGSRARLLLNDNLIVNLGELSEFVIATPARRTGFDMLKGTMRIFQRDRTNIQIQLPNASGKIRG